MLSKSVALECLKGGDRIRVNCVSPTGVKTPMWSTMPFFRDLVRALGTEDAAYAAMGNGHPNSRWAASEEVAAAVLFLASDESAFVTGTNLMFEQCDTA